MTASLLYSLTPINDNAGFGPLSPGWINANDTAPIENGYFIGNNFVLPGYSPGSLVYFMVLAYSGSSYASSVARAHSNAFSETMATGPDLPGFMDNMQPFLIQQLPEPSILTLAGLGLAAWVVAQKNSR